jgi:hypothetical protein
VSPGGERPPVPPELRLPLGRARGYPFTAPAAPATMYRWANTNTPSAGSIAIAVNAMMPASFCECCVWNV